MKHFKALLVTTIMFISQPLQLYADNDYLESLTQGQVIHDFQVANLYDNSDGKAMGGRFVSQKHGFIVDMMQIESVPQAFIWIKTPPSSSKGEPHACEHLLLGKGNKGRYVSALEDMALTSSTAYTEQTRTCYHFNTIAGEETFYKVFQAKLNALLHPDFTDEEITREVCHVGVSEDPATGKLTIEEKGTVYTEMVSSFERPYYAVYRAIDKLVYGENHPLTYISGGQPDIMRTMIPEDMWKFHKLTHRLDNMGVIVSIPGDVTIESMLKSFSEILDNCSNGTKANNLTNSITVSNLPAPQEAVRGSTKLVGYPSDRSEDPGYMVFSWPADLEVSPHDGFLLNFFIQSIAGGETSNLYDLFINSETRVIDLGATSVFGGVDDVMGSSIYFGLNGLDNKKVTQAALDSVKNLIVNEITRVSAFSDNSPELKEFNDRVISRTIAGQKQYDDYLNSPPMFGFRRGTAGGWLSLLEDLEKEDGFRKSLVMSSHFNYMDSLLKLDENIWTDYIKNWHLTSVAPYTLGAIPDPQILVKKKKEKELRLTNYINNFQNEYGVEKEQEAIARYKEEFDSRTAILKKAEAKDELPPFVKNPPLTLDDQLQYETETIANDIPGFFATFENKKSSMVRIAFNLDVIPESLLVYLPLLDQVLTRIGTIKNGDTLTYDIVQERLRKEVLGLSSGFDHDSEGKRIELVLTGRGKNFQELKNVIGWMQASLFSPYLSVNNLARMRDLVDQSLISYRNVTKGAEEDWVRYPSNGYRFQKNPLYLSTNCFLTEVHHIQRIKWMLTDAVSELEYKQLSLSVKGIIIDIKGKSRDELVLYFANGAVDRFDSNAEQIKEIGRELIRSLELSLADIPDISLSSDIEYLCNCFLEDIQVSPSEAIGSLNQILNFIRHSDNARICMVSNSKDRKAVTGLLNQLVEKLDKTPSNHQQYESYEHITERMKSRYSETITPVYVGLLFDGTRNGVMQFSAKMADSYDTNPESILNCLSGKLYGGGGPHGLFMKTWAAGLAYSNGYGYRQSTGRVSYYAERCPDVGETMKFVVSLLKDAIDDPGLTDYSIAQVFQNSRAPSKYEQRGISMANDLQDGKTPEIISAFRKAVLEMKSDKDLYAKLKRRMEKTYGPVLIGYGDQLSESKDGFFFLIGPEEQFESIENYIASVESKQTVYRLYPRDYWLIN